MAPLPPRYTRPRLLGAGGMAEVHAAFDESLRRNVAVKVLAARLANDATMRERFLREATLAASLAGHPHVVTVHDVGEWEGRPYIVMELAEGGSVAERLRDGLPEHPTALTWLREAADALDAAHARGIVHRDVKPANLLLDEYGAIRVSDFGIARDGDGTLTASGEILGTAGYLAPEQWRGERCTPATDRYSLAVVARELLTGRRDGRVAGRLAPLFDRALADDPQARYPSAIAFTEALARATGEPVEPEMVLTSRQYSTRHDGRGRVRRRLAIVGAAVAAVAVAAASAVATYALGVEPARDSAAAAPPAPTTCTASAIDHDANVVVQGARADAYCRGLARRLSSDGDAWGYRTGRQLFAPDHGTSGVTLVCRFRDGRMRLVVYDSGSQSIGRDVCLNYRTPGWRGAGVA